MKPTLKDAAAAPAEIWKTCARRAAEGDPAIWIDRTDTETLEGYASQLQSPETQPLFGVPFAIKDNIDLQGSPTTAACPEYGYEPEVSSTVVQRLIDAGAIPIGKTNLDQFATGLVGVRTPYGVCGNAYDPDFIPGGSSAGSAVAVAKGQAVFSLGTDTAGSGRVPAAFNNLVGLKPTRGVFSNFGVVPACKTLDCVSVFAHEVDDARRVFNVAAGFDPKDPWSRRDQRPLRKSGPIRFGVPARDQLRFFGNEAFEKLYAQSIERLKSLGWQCVEIDYRPFAEAARLLYEGPWVAERYAAIEQILCDNPQALFPVTRDIISAGINATAVDGFNAQYRLAELRRAVEPIWEEMDLLVTPTAGTHYTIAEVQKDPVVTNSNLGYYTNFMNLLDLCAVAVPAGFTPAAMPFGVTFVAPALYDHYLLDRAEEFTTGTAPAPSMQGVIQFAVCGAHLRGLPLNGQITERGGQFVREALSAREYQLIVLPGEPPKPGMIRVAEGGASIALEIWEMPIGEFGSFLNLIPEPLGIASVLLSDGSRVKGFSCESIAASHAEDISHFGSWRAYLAARF